MSTHQPTEPLAPVDPQPVLGLHGEPCAACGSPLAADQRYCLSCGMRRAGARLAFRDILAEPAPAVAAQPAGTPPASSASSRGGALAALAGLGVILLALGMGVLIGNAGQGDSGAAATAPQVINLGGAATTPAASAGAAAGAAGAATKASKGAAAKRKAGSQAGSPAAAKAKNTTLKSLDSLSPQQYQKQSRKLPKVVGTGGTPPPKDDKPAAGGGDFETIG